MPTATRKASAGQRMPEEERTEPTADELDECQAWDEGRTDPEWTDTDSASYGA